MNDPLEISPYLERPPLTTREKRLMEFIRRIARMMKDGEEDDDGEPFDMTNDDAVDTLHRLIDDARDIADEIDGKNTTNTTKKD